MNFTGLSEFLWFLLVFGAMFAFTVWRQQRDRRRREERMAAMSAPAEIEPATKVVLPVPTAPETAPDISWGRGPAVPAPPPEVRPDWREAPVLAQPPALPARTTPASTRAPRRTAPVAAAVVARRGVLQFRSEAGLRQAMVALTVLGPCRAIEPYGGVAAQQVPGTGNPARPPQGR